MTTVFRRLRGSLATLAALGALQAPGVAVAAAQTLPDQLIGATEAFLEEQVANYLQRAGIAGRHDIQVNRLDSRLRMPACDQPLVASLESPAQPVGRVTVRIGCQGRSAWSLLVPAQVRLYRQVVRVRDVGTLSQGYLTEPDQALGSMLTRPVSIDQVLTPNHLERAPVVSKGDHVVISAGGATLSVRMPGEAQEEGAVGQQIRVRNLSSQRVIRARITGPGQVVVDL